MKMLYFLILLIFISCSSSDKIKHSSRYPASFESSVIDHTLIDKDGILPDNIKWFLLWEFYANNASNPDQRGPQEFKMAHFDIPMKLVESQVDENWDIDLKKSLIVEKDGEKYLRWPVNPEDDHYFKVIREYLAKNGVSTEPQYLFRGYLTSSKSMVIYNPENSSIFSLKVSMRFSDDRPFHSDRLLDRLRLQMARAVDEVVRRLDENIKFKHVVPLREPAGFLLDEINQGMMIRTLRPILDSNQYMLPAFSALHEKVGVEIAKLNGSDNPVEFWKEHLVKPLAEASAEFQAFTGLNYSSAHSQQYGILLDKDLKPTGKIVFRDLGDMEIFKPFYEKIGLFEWMKNIWPRKLPFADEPIPPEFQYTKPSKILPVMFLNKKLKTYFALFHGISPPKWLIADVKKGYLRVGLQDWIDSYFQTYDRTFSAITGIPIEVLGKAEIIQPLLYFVKNAGGYISRNSKVTGEKWDYYLDHAKCIFGHQNSFSGKNCLDFINQSEWLRKYSRTNPNNCISNAAKILSK